VDHEAANSRQHATADRDVIERACVLTKRHTIGCDDTDISAQKNVLFRIRLWRAICRLRWRGSTRR
jgi:hypothetical protein